MELALIEHEAAHLLFPSAGAPDADEWLDAMERDNPSGADRWRLVLSPDDLAGYVEAEHLLEDWAWSVAELLMQDRGPEGLRFFRRQRPHRAAIIDRVLGAAA
jgi:cobalamin biosynthesis Mg chelatase CobN